MDEKIIEILSEFTLEPAEKITENSRLVGDLDLTSLDVIGIISRIEDEFEIEVDEAQISDFQTVKDVTEYVKSHQKQGA